MNKFLASGLVGAGIVIGAIGGSALTDASASAEPRSVTGVVLGAEGAACVEKVAGGMLDDDATSFSCQKAESLNGKNETIIVWRCSADNGGVAANIRQPTIPAQGAKLMPPGPLGRFKHK